MTSADTVRMPALFIGHGSPMNAVEDNRFSRTWRQLGTALPRPRAVLCISAHWETSGVQVTAVAEPPTIHDFFGFPDRLFRVRYPAPGSPQLAEYIRNHVGLETVGLDCDRGLDHGTWSVLRPMFPEADIPVVQLSLDTRKSPAEHFEFAKVLGELRNRGILIIGSGNIVHNLGALVREDRAHEWAADFDLRVKQLILAGDIQALIDYPALGPTAALAVPSPEHYLPLLYILAVRTERDDLSFLTESVTLGAISMRSLRVDSPAPLHSIPGPG